MLGRASVLGSSGSRRGEAGGCRALAPDEVVRLPRLRAGIVVRVLAGLVVVSREGDPEDHVLEAGGEAWFPGKGLSLAWALEASRIELRAGAARREGRQPAAATAGARRSLGAGAPAAGSSLPRVDISLDSARGGS
jgi:hypothetical protein